MYKNKRKIVCALMATVLFSVSGLVSFDAPVSAETPSVLPYQIGVDETTDSVDVIHYEEVTANSKFILYADMEKGYFAVQSKASGEIWYSTPNDVLEDTYSKGTDKWTLRSQLSIGYLFKSDILTSQESQRASSQIECLEEGSAQVTRVENGIHVLYDFANLGIKIPVSYVLTDDGLSAGVDIQNIDEGEECVLTDILLLPSFGAGNHEAEGYLLIPDGSGALVEFNNGRASRAYESMVYGDDQAYFEEIDSVKKQAVRLPMFATVYNNRALVGIITKGDSSASVWAVNGNETRGYNAVGSKVHLRNIENLTMFQTRNIGRLTELSDGFDTYEVQYYMPEDDAMDYVKVADTYRQYLIEEKGLTANVQKPALAIDLYGIADSRSAFLGFAYDKKIALTTFDQAQEIVNSLKEAGVTEIATRYLGWGKDGLLNQKIPSKATAGSVLGGKKGFLNFAAYMNEQEYALYPDVDFVQFRVGSNRNAVRNVFNEVIYRNDRMRSVFATKLSLEPIRLLLPQKLADIAARYMKSYKKFNVNAISLSTLSRLNYSNATLKNPYHKSQFANDAVAILKSYKDNGFSVAVDDANAYAIPYADRIYNSPIDTSGYDMFDKEIPFYQIVTHGFVATTVQPTMQSDNPEINFLKAVESGSELLYGAMYAESSVVSSTRYDNLYSTQFTLWKDEAVSVYKKYQPLLEAVYDKKIVGHREYADDVMVTTFEGGCQVVVNYNSCEVIVDGHTIAPLDYWVKDVAQ